MREPLDETKVLRWERLVLRRIKRAIVRKHKSTPEQTLGTLRALACALASIHCELRKANSEAVIGSLADGFHDFADRYIKEFTACERN